MRRRRKKTTWMGALVLEFASIAGIVTVAQPNLVFDSLRTTAAPGALTSLENDLPAATGNAPADQPLPGDMNHPDMNRPAPYYAANTRWNADWNAQSQMPRPENGWRTVTPPQPSAYPGGYSLPRAAAHVQSPPTVTAPNSYHY